MRLVTEILPAELVRAPSGMLPRKTLFGTDYPLITPQRWLDDFGALEVRPDAVPLILKDNAVRLLGLADGATSSGVGPALTPRRPGQDG